MIRSRVPALVLAIALLVAAWPAIAASYQDADGETGRLANALATRAVLPPVWGDTLAPSAPVYRFEEAWMLASLLDPREHPFNVTAWPDVPPGYWALQAVNHVVGVDLMRGENDRFNGDRRVRRGEFIQALDRLLKYRAIPPPPPQHSRYEYTDVQGELAEAVDRAANLWNFLEPGPRARPEGLLSRESAVLMVARAAPLVDGTFTNLLRAPTPSPTPRPTPTPVPVVTGTAATPLPSGNSPTGSPEAPAATPGLPTTGPQATEDASFSLPPFSWTGHLAIAPVSFGFGDILTSFFAPLNGGAVSLVGRTGNLDLAIDADAALFSGSTANINQLGGGAGLLWHLDPGGLDAAVGGSVGFDSLQVSDMNGPTSPVSAAASRTFLGIGPVARLDSRIGPLRTNLQLSLQLGGILAQKPGFGLDIGYAAGATLPLPGLPVEAWAGLRGAVVTPLAGFDNVTQPLVGIGGSF